MALTALVLPECGLINRIAFDDEVRREFGMPKKESALRTMYHYQDQLTLVDFPGSWVYVAHDEAAELWLLANAPEGSRSLPITLDQLQEYPRLPGDRWQDCLYVKDGDLCQHHRAQRLLLTADAAIAAMEDETTPSVMYKSTVKHEMIPQRLRAIALRATKLADELDPPPDLRAQAMLPPLKALTWQIYGMMLLLAAVGIIPLLKLVWKALWWTP